MSAFWTTWANPDPDEIAELVAYARWFHTINNLPPGWGNFPSSNWENDDKVRWDELGIPRSEYKYFEAKLKTEIMKDAKLFADAFRNWTGLKANWESGPTPNLSLNIDNLVRSGYADETKIYEVVTGVTFNPSGGGSITVTKQRHTVVISRGMITSWLIENI